MIWVSHSSATGASPWVSTDVFNYRQSVALLNGLNYRARPVFQSYGAYTPALQEANLTFYRSDRRPHYVLFALETIDNRFPTLDDAPTIPYLLNNYRPVLAERNFLLLEIRPGNAHNSGRNPGLMVHAPNVMAFDVPPGAKQISGRFGLLEEPYTGDGATDGVEFTVEVKNRDGEARQGFKRLLQPKSIPSDRGTMAFSVPLKTQDQEIFLTTTVGPHMDGAYDW